MGWRNQGENLEVRRRINFVRIHIDGERRHILSKNPAVVRGTDKMWK